jgi:hypothetical protein
MRAEVFIDQSEGGVAEISVVRRGLPVLRGNTAQLTMR